MGSKAFRGREGEERERRIEGDDEEDKRDEEGLKDFVLSKVRSW